MVDLILIYQATASETKYQIGLLILFFEYHSLFVAVYLSFVIILMVTRNLGGSFLCFGL